MRASLRPVVAAVLGLVCASAWSPTAASASTTATVSVTVNSKQPAAGDIEVTNSTGSSVYGTCAAPATPGSATCTYSVPADSGVLLVAQPAAGEDLGKWTGLCKGTPGDVCHVQSRAAGTTVTEKVVLARGRAGVPELSMSNPEMAGSGPGACDPGESVTVTGTGFPASTPATLTDDGTAVASANTDASGSVTVTDGPGAGEPGVYRTLAITAGGVTARGDVYNSGFFCAYQTPGAPTTGSVSVTVNASGLDANSSNVSVTFPGQTPVVINADPTGSGSATTPSYSCTVGTSYTATLSGTRGAGSRQKYSFTTTFGVTC